ncbi:MAG: hypothetical protein IVW51_16805 [Thermaceae bacterium]|nr:hypothetical protein [Thermaceae bacterium]
MDASQFWLEQALKRLAAGSPDLNALEIEIKSAYAALLTEEDDEENDNETAPMAMGDAPMMRVSVSGRRK